jgi:prepilin-type processing-associated H-X9-DG protein
MLKRLGFCLLAVLFQSHLFAQALADRLPADATVYIGWRGTDDLGPGYATSHLKALIDASNFSQFLHQSIPQLIDKYGNSDPQVAQALDALTSVGLPLWKHPSALYVGKVSFANGQPQPPHVALLCQAGADADAMKAALQTQMQNNPAPVPLNVVRVGDVVAVTFGFGPNEFTLPAANDATSLGNDPAFKAAMGQVGADPVMALYVNIESLVAAGDQFAAQSTDPQAAQNWPKLRDALGLAGLKRIALADGFDGQEWGTRAFIAAPGPHNGLLSSMDQQPLPDELLAKVPESATLVGAGRFDLAKTIESIRSGINSFNPDMGQQIDGVLMMASGMLGVDIQKELLPAFGDEWVYYTDPRTGGKGMAGLTVINHLHDPQQSQATFEKFQTGLQQLAAQQVQNKNINLAFHKIRIGQADVNYLAIPLVTPSWAIQGDYLCIGLYPQVVASAAGHIAAKNRSILDNPDFVALRTRLGGDKASTIRFMDLRATAPDAYATWRGILSLDQIVDVFGVDAPPALMPPLDQLIDQLTPAGQVSWTDDAGWHSRAICPFPGSELLGADPSSMSVGQEAMLVSILLPSLNRAREQANRVKSASNLREIGQASLLYANDHNGKLPDSLGEILTKEDITPQVLISPRTSTSAPPPGLPPDQLSQWADHSSDYVWLGKGKNNNTVAADAVLAYEKFEGLHDGINILFGDGHVEFETMVQAHRLVDAATQSQPNLPKDGGL